MSVSNIVKKVTRYLITPLTKREFLIQELQLAIIKSLIGVVIFLAILVVGFIYEWKKGALDWE